MSLSTDSVEVIAVVVTDSDGSIEGINVGLLVGMVLGSVGVEEGTVVGIADGTPVG